MKRVQLPEKLDLVRIRLLAEEIGGAEEPLLLVGTCAGLDLGADLDDDTAWDLLRELFVALHTGPPSAALVTGPVLGGGVGVVAACDVVVATPGATFGLPELVFGLIPGAIAPAMLGRLTAGDVRRLALGTDHLDAQQALALGLADHVADDARGVERHLPRLDPAAVRALRELLRPDYIAALDVGIAASRSRIPHAVPRLARWANGEVPWSM